MSDIPTTHTLPEDALRMMRTAFRMDPRSARCLEDAEAAITRLREHAAELALERDGFQEECKRLRADLAAAQADAKSWKTVALSNQAASQSHQERWAKAEAELAEMREESDKLAERSRLYDAALERLSDYANQLASAQEREQRMREALEPFAQFAGAHVDEDGWSAGRMGERICDWFGPSEFRDARAALSAMRGGP